MKSGVDLTGKMSENSKGPSSIIKDVEFVNQTESELFIGSPSNPLFGLAAKCTCNYVE